MVTLNQAKKQMDTLYGKDQENRIYIILDNPIGSRPEDKRKFYPAQNPTIWIQ